MLFNIDLDNRDLFLVIHIECNALPPRTSLALAMLVKVNTDCNAGPGGAGGGQLISRISLEDKKL